MAVSSDLISQLVKVTNDKTEIKEETTVFGTVAIVDEVSYVKIDGSDLLTPISTTTKVTDGERVTVMIKNHTATVTGNLSSPSARVYDVEEVEENLGNEISDFEIVIAQKVDTEDFVAEQARIDSLVADDVVIKESLTAAEADIDILQAGQLTVTERLTAAEADIEKIVSGSIDVSVLDAKYAKIADLEATNTDVYNLEATYASFETTTTNKLTAVDASISELEADKLGVNTADITYAKIAELEAINTNITNLEADVAGIDTLIFGSATGTTIQTSFANAVIAQLGDAQIKSAMIENIAANKITAGDIITNNVRVRSEDGSLLISDETIQISDATRVRVQIGKDSANDYSINIWDADGNLMFSEGGITDSAIKDAIIRNDMVSDTANIAAHKLDIDSLFEEINGSANTIKSTQIYLDDQAQTLNVAFKELETEFTKLGSTVSSQGTQLSVVQGQIESKVWQQDIDTVSSEMSTKYSKIEQEVDSVSTTVASHTTTVAAVENRIATVETTLDGFQSTVSATYATKSQLNELAIEGRNLIRNTRNPIDKSYWQQGYITLDKELNENVFFITRSESNEVTIGTHRITVSPGDTYTVSAWIKRTANVSSVDFWFLTRAEDSTKDFDYAQGYQGLIPTPDTWARYTWTFTVDPNAYEGYFRIDHNGSSDGADATIYYTMIKVEKGSKATDWTPAPEDIATKQEVSDATTRISQTETEISQLITETTTNTNDIASLKLTTNGLTTQVSNLKIGGRNLAVGSSAYRKDTPFSNTTTGIDGMKVMPGVYMPVEIGETYIIQCCTDGIWGNHATDGSGTGQTHIFLYLMTEGQTAGQYVNAVALQDDISNGYTGRRFWSFTVPNNGTAYDKIMFRFDIHSNGTTEHTVNWWDLKVERGTKATDWTPPPEDMATVKDADLAQVTAEAAQETASVAETLIQQLSESISTLVTDGNGTSLMTQTDSGWTFSTAKIQTAIASASESLDALNNELGNTNNTVDVLQQAVADLGEIAEYVKISTYENEPCIELGEGDSEFKLRITNTRILFIEGSSVIAHFTNQSLHIKKAVIEEELQQGEFVWKARANGNLGLIWKGVTS